jgi:hypothetical protein
MPRSSNARFDENGFAEAVRDIEQLFMQLQDGTNDLNAEAQAVDADTPEGDGGGGGDDTSTATALRGFQYSNNAPIVLAGTTPLVGMSLAGFDSLGGFSPSSATFTAPFDGVYSFELLGYISWTTTLAARVGLALNPINSAPMYSDIPTLTTAGSSTFAVSGIRPLVAGETVTLQAAIVGGFLSAGVWDAPGNFTVWYLGPTA